MPARWQDEVEHPAQCLNHSGLDPEVNLQIENLSRVLLGSLDGRAADLVKIASYAYSADQSVSRGGEKDVYGKKWHREMCLAIRVSDPRFWKRRSTSTALQSVLDFVSDDTWEFHFTKTRAAQSQLTLGLSGEDLHSDSDCVVLFSGGADSLGAVVEAIESGKRPLLVSYRTSRVIDSRRHRLVQKLRQRYPEWSLPEIGAWIHLRGGSANSAPHARVAGSRGAEARCAPGSASLRCTMGRRERSRSRMRLASRRATRRCGPGQPRSTPGTAATRTLPRSASRSCHDSLMIRLSRCARRRPAASARSRPINSPA